MAMGMVTSTLSCYERARSDKNNGSGTELHIPKFVRTNFYPGCSDKTSILSNFNARIRPVKGFLESIPLCTYIVMLWLAKIIIRLPYQPLSFTSSTAKQ
jgi:hypothetical protein